MAATRLIPIHIGGRTIADVIDYVENPEKTRNGELISSYQCDSRTADTEFQLTKNQYAQLTGRSQGKRDIIAYHTRQAFKPGEITPEEANEIGRELAMAFTKGRHSFIVCTHVDRAHVHNHIIFNSTALDCQHKFRNFIGSAFALRRVSDRLCVEHGLSIIENPKPSRGSYGTWLGEDRPPSFQQQLRDVIDTVLEGKPADFDAFLAAMREAGYEAKLGKHLAFLGAGQKKFIRCDTLKGDHTVEAIRERIEGKRQYTPPAKTRRALQPQQKTPSLLIDIQAKIQAGKGAGYERFAKVFNLKQAAQTLIYLQEHGLTDYADLAAKTSAATQRHNTLSDQLKVLEGKLTANAALQKQIVTYAKTRATYLEYRKAGYSKAFKATHEADILLHQTAKKHFDEMGLRKLPTVASLRTEYAAALEEKKTAYRDFRQARDEMRELLVIKANVDQLLNTPTPLENEHQRPEPSR